MMRRLSVAFLSVCTSATNRSCRPPPFCIRFQRRASSYSRCTSSGSSSSRPAAVPPRAMELLDDRSKRPRNDDDDDDEGPRGPDLDADCGGGMTEQQSIILSPYENKTGRIISSCPKCHGEGRVRAPMSKKARALKMRSNSNNGAAEGDDGPAAPPRPETAARDVVAPPPTKPCRACDGTGLIATRFPPPPSPPPPPPPSCPSEFTI